MGLQPCAAATGIHEFEGGLNRRDSSSRIEVVNEVYRGRREMLGDQAS